uniref:Odorant receptor n=1 Tax=Histia rhodope TaxID=1453155 RepID=A0A7G4KBW2_9NEOP|nr:odorant receptor [Histia rhodope]
MVVALFCFMPITLMAVDYYKNGKYKVNFPFLVKYFFDPFTEIWPYVYFHQVVSTFIVWVNVYGPDTFFYAFCVYVQMHFRILSQRLRKLFYKPNLLVEDKEKLIKLLKRHQELIQLVKDFETLYTSSNLWNMVISSILICLSAFNATTNPDAKAVLTFICFLFMSLSQISILCFFGDMIVNSSALVAEAAYSCGWYNVDADVKKSLLIVIMRAHTPCKLTAANFAVLNLRAFAMIISKSWSYFALLKTLYK